MKDTERAFLEQTRVAHLATADAHGEPHVVPVCYALTTGAGSAATPGSSPLVYITIDEKPKRTGGRGLKRIRNMLENPRVALVADRYDEDWTRLAWVMVRGPAEILDAGAEHARAQAMLTAKYPQLAAMQITNAPVIKIHAERVSSWGALDGPAVPKGLGAR